MLLINLFFYFSFVYPNPTEGNYTLQLSHMLTKDAAVEVTDVLGRKVKEFTISAGTTTAASALLVPGVYVITISNSNGRIQHKLVVD